MSFYWTGEIMDKLETRYVETGSYYVGETEPLILEAYLGTCVGVALYDPEANVGGLIHILLPEPVSPGSSFMPEKYAVNGMPLFIKALNEAGADPEKLRAYVAGGALVGPLEEQDLNLDIGGRTTEIVLKILKNEGISIEKIETGGFFSCRISLNMKNWECAVDPLGSDKLNGAEAFVAPSSKDISHTIENIQPIPQIALKILRTFVADDDFDFEEIANEVRKDQVISAKTLRLSNSAMFARKHQIDSLDHALVLLGKDLLIKLVIMAAVKDFFNQSSKGYSGFHNR